MEKKLQKISKRYDRFSIIYDWIEAPIEKRYYSKWREILLHNLKGEVMRNLPKANFCDAKGRAHALKCGARPLSVLEVGVGTGKNLPYYDPNRVELTAIDINKKMMDRAKERANQLKLKVNFRLIDSEKFPFPADSFDYVVATFVLCSVNNQETVLKEMERVLKPEGKILLLEHVLSKNKLIAFWQQLHNPLTKFLVGFNINRDTVGTIRKIGLKIITEKNLVLKDVFKQLELQKG